MSADHGRTMRSGPADKGPEPKLGVPTPENLDDRIKEFEAGVAEGMNTRVLQQHTLSMPIDMPVSPQMQMLKHPLWVPFSVWYSTRMISQADAVARARLAGTIEPLF